MQLSRCGDHVPQTIRVYRYRRSLWSQSVAGCDAAMAGWRQYDCRCKLRTDELRALRRDSKPVPAILRTRSVSVPRSTILSASAWRMWRATRATPRLRHARVAQGSGPAAHRQRPAQGQRAFIRTRRSSSGGYRFRAKSRSHRGARGTSLRATDRPSFRPRGHRMPVARVLQHLCGNRRPGRCPATHCARIRATDLNLASLSQKCGCDRAMARRTD